MLKDLSCGTSSTRCVFCVCVCVCVCVWTGCSPVVSFRCPVVHNFLLAPDCSCVLLFSLFGLLFTCCCCCCPPPPPPPGDAELTAPAAPPLLSAPDAEEPRQPRAVRPVWTQRHGVGQLQARPGCAHAHTQKHTRGAQTHTCTHAHANASDGTHTNVRIIWGDLAEVETLNDVCLMHVISSS